MFQTDNYILFHSSFVSLYIERHYVLQIVSFLMFRISDTWIR